MFSASCMKSKALKYVNLNSDGINISSPTNKKYALLIDVCLEYPHILHYENDVKFKAQCFKVILAKSHQTKKGPVNFFNVATY